MSDLGDDDLLRGESLEEEGIVPPADEPVAVEDTGTTSAEEIAGESVSDRFNREEPDLWANTGPAGAGYQAAGRLVQPDAGMVDLDDTAEEVGSDSGERTGLSAEEAAMRIEEDPEGMGGGMPGYLSDEED